MSPSQPAEVEGEPVPLPGQELQPVPAAILEHEQVARERVPDGVVAAHGGEGVEPRAGVHWVDAHADSAGQAEGQNGVPPRAATSRATAAGSAATGARTTSPVGRMTAKKVAWLAPRAVQNAWTDWPDCFQTVIVSRQNYSRSARRR
jgi:hypothetical protein